jgi:hypothetical protein
VVGSLTVDGLYAPALVTFRQMEGDAAVPGFDAGAALENPEQSQEPAPF